MLVVDNILMAPASGLMFILKQVLHAAEQEVAGEADNIRAQLSELYMMLETRAITPEEFDAQEKLLLDRLDRSEPASADADNDPESDI